MPIGYVIMNAGTVRGPDGRDHEVLDAIHALPWMAQLCPLMRHEYTIWDREPAWPNRWAWDVISSMLLVGNSSSFKAFFRGYQDRRVYWDAPDGLRYWRGGYEIDRGLPDDAGLRRVDQGAKRAEGWDGPPWAPHGIGLYEQDEKKRWWPTKAALDSGYLACDSCELTKLKKTIVATPKDPERALEFLAAAQSDSRTKLGRPLSREELTEVLRRYATQYLETGW